MNSDTDTQLVLYQNPFRYNIIYIFQAAKEQGEKYSGLLKIGMTRLKPPIDGKLPTQQALDDAAINKRIPQQTQQVGFVTHLLYTTLAITDEGTSFNDSNVHQVLKRSGYNCIELGTHDKEWFRIDLPKAIAAINCVKEGKASLGNLSNQVVVPLKLRTEQQEAIDKAFRAFKLKNKKCLWNCKMRFGKTITALALIKQSFSTTRPFTKILIATNRPSVCDEWNNDYKNFFPDLNLTFYSRNRGEKLETYQLNTKNSLVFASAPDLKGSEIAGGKFKKHDNIFNTSWDLIIIDEAHEGWNTKDGDNVLDQLINNTNKNKPCVLYLSGTPFNIEKDFTEEEIFSWTYNDEQRAKVEWNAKHHDGSNPYEACPQMLIYTLNLDEITNHDFHNDYSEVYFNFAEFFKTNEVTNKFVYEGAVKAFLNKLHSDDDEIKYPFTKRFRNYFHHTLWLVPGVKEAKALVKLLQADETFGAFTIVDVTGPEMESNEALEKVKQAIGSNPTKTWTITVTCQRLTVGATIPQWTAILYLAGTNITSKTKYLQSIFRVQSACNDYDGMIKDKCYVFDFAPERTLRIIASQCIQEKGNNASISEYKDDVEEWLQLMPVISLTKAKMQLISTTQLFSAIEQVQATEIYESGFLDSALFDLSKVNDSITSKIKKYGTIFEENKATKANQSYVENNQGIKSNGSKKTTKNNESKQDKSQNELLDEWRKLLQIVSSRLPLLIYGSYNLDLKEVIDINNFVETIDEESWQQFMPVNFSKQDFKDDFVPFINPINFNFAAHKLLNEIAEANKLSVGLRITKLTEIINKFQNPDKETVFTPWWVVNLQLSTCLGGESFYQMNGKSVYEVNNSTDFSSLNPYLLTRKVSIDSVTPNLFKLSNKFLDINSKLGLYLLYLAYSLFVKAKQNQPILNESDLWKQIIENNIFALCKSHMAQTLTIKTLIGDNTNIRVNSYIPHDDDIYIDKKILNHNPNDEIDKLIKKLNDPLTWKKSEITPMKFDAIVGNPPYDVITKKNPQPIYPNFVKLAIKLSPNYISLIIPLKWMVNADFAEFRDFIKQNNNFQSLYVTENGKCIFKSVEIKGGVCFFLWNKNYHQPTIEITEFNKTEKGCLELRSNVNEKNDVFQEIIITNPLKISIVKKVKSAPNFEMLDNYVTPPDPYDIKTNYWVQTNQHWSKKPFESSYECIALKPSQENKKQKDNSNRIYIYIMKILSRIHY